MAVSPSSFHQPSWPQKLCPETESRLGQRDSERERGGPGFVQRFFVCACQLCSPETTAWASAACWLFWRLSCHWSKVSAVGWLFESIADQVEDIAKFQLWNRYGKCWVQASAEPVVRHLYNWLPLQSQARHVLFHHIWQCSFNSFSFCCHRPRL